MAQVVFRPFIIINVEEGQITGYSIDQTDIISDTVEVTPEEEERVNDIASTFYDDHLAERIENVVDDVFTKRES